MMMPSGFVDRTSWRRRNRSSTAPPLQSQRSTSNTSRHSSSASSGAHAPVLAQTDNAAERRAATRTPQRSASPALPPRHTSRHDCPSSETSMIKPRGKSSTNGPSNRSMPATVRTPPRSISTAVRSVCGPDSHRVVRSLIRHRCDRGLVDVRPDDGNRQRRAGAWWQLRVLRRRHVDTGSASLPCTRARPADETQHICPSARQGPAPLSTMMSVTPRAASSVSTS